MGIFDRFSQPPDPASMATAVLLALLFLPTLIGCSRRTSPPLPELPPSASTASMGSRIPLVPGRCLDAEQSSKYTVLFVASAPQLQSIFVGWRTPQEPRTKAQRNPFTGKNQDVRTTEPDDADAGPAARDWDLRTSEIPEDAGYQGYLEARIPPEIRRLPHRMMKRVDFEMMAIAEALTGKEDVSEALFPPNGCATSLPLLRLPDGATTALRNTSGDALTKLAARLIKHEAFSGWTVADISAFLDDLRAWLKASTTNDGLYILPT